MRKLFAYFLAAALIFAPTNIAQTLGGKAVIGGKTAIGSGGPAQPVVVQNCVAGVLSALTLTCGNFSVGTLTNGNLLVAFGFGVAAVTLTTTVAGCGLTWTSNGTVGAQFGVEFFATAPVTSTATCTGASRPTINGTGAVGNMAIMVLELTNVINTTDGVPTYADGSLGQNFSGPSLTTAVNNDIFLVFCWENGGSLGPTLNAPFTTIFSAAVTGKWFNIGYDVVTPPATVNPSYTFAGTASQFVRGAIAIEQ